MTKANYDELTAGKTVFIKFFAPWCGHCKELAPQWERMANEWVGHKQGLVASVDCTTEEDWCVSMGIEGFPTLLFGDPSQGGVFLETYTGDKSYEDLSKFANETLSAPVCSPGNPRLCDKATKKKLQKMWKLAPSDLQKAIDEKYQWMEKAEKEFRDAFQKMQDQYDKSSQEHGFLVAGMKAKLKILDDILYQKSKKV